MSANRTDNDDVYCGYGEIIKPMIREVIEAGKLRYKEKDELIRVEEHKRKKTQKKKKFID